MSVTLQESAGLADCIRKLDVVRLLRASSHPPFELQVIVLEEPNMQTAKDEVRSILDALPDDATLEDIQYRIYVRQAIDAGLRDIAEGRTLSKEEVEQRVARWIGK